MDLKWLILLTLMRGVLFFSSSVKKDYKKMDVTEGEEQDLLIEYNAAATCRGILVSAPIIHFILLFEQISNITQVFNLVIMVIVFVFLAALFFFIPFSFIKGANTIFWLIVLLIFDLIMQLFIYDFVKSLLM